MALTHPKLQAPWQSAPGRGPESETTSRARVTFVGDAALLDGVRAGNPAAMAEFHDRFAGRVRGILWGVLGPDHELSDLHHDVFVRALGSIHSLKEVDALQSWMSAVAVHTAKAALEKRLSRRRWQAPLSSKPVPEPASPDPSGRLDAREALRVIHTLLDRLPVSERIAFGLRFLDGFELVEVAAACEVSLATIKRRLARAEQRFTALAQSSPVLMELLQKGSPKWTRR